MSTNAPLETRTGIHLSVRAATRHDAAALQAFFDAVSDEDRRFRFLGASKHVGLEQLEPLLQTDQFTSQSFLAFDQATDELVASALLACDDKMDTGEIAVSIRSDYRGKGVGWALLDFLAENARSRGVRRVISIESRDNHAAIELEREKGFIPQTFDDDPTMIVLSKTLR